MSPRKFLNFLRSKTGLLILFLLAACVMLILANSRKNFGKDATPVNGKLGASEADSKKPQLIERIKRDMVPFSPPTSDDRTPKATTPGVKRPEAEAPSLPPISIFAETPSSERKPAELSEDFAPFGRLIQCELIVTVDSSSINTPVIGLVTENVYHHGHLIVPVGTEVHGSAQVDRVRERIASDGRWTLVWQSGEERRRCSEAATATPNSEWARHHRQIPRGRVNQVEPIRPHRISKRCRCVEFACRDYSWHTFHLSAAKTSPLSAPAPLPLRLSLPTPKTSRPPSHSRCRRSALLRGHIGAAKSAPRKMPCAEARFPKTTRT